MASDRIRPRVRDAVLQALGAGVVPSAGLQHIQVGRKNEMNALIKDTERVADGGSAFRLVVGDYGAGKTFFLHVIRHVAHNHKLVTLNADLSPERRLVASDGKARNLYSELITSMATRSRPDGNALPAIVERYVHQKLSSAKEQGKEVDELIRRELSQLENMVAGYDMTTVLCQFCRGYERGDEALKGYALRWLRGEYTTKTQARQDLGVRTIIDDHMVYDALKVLAKFVTLAGYEGIFVMLDEGVNLFKIAHTQGRKSNYEMVLRILNDTLQGQAQHFGFVLGLTPEALYDPRRGLCSYDALASRLARNRFAEKSGLVDYNHPAIHLQNLSPEELFLLLKKITHVAAGGDSAQHLVDDDGITAFLQHCQKAIGAAYYQTPRESIRSFVDLLNLLEQYPDQTWRDLLDHIEVREDIDTGTADAGIESDTRGDDELKDFKL